MKPLLFLSAVLTISISTACSENSINNSGSSRNFDSLTRPYFEYNEAEDFYLLQPWEYNAEVNSNRTYPLVVYLHGSGGAGNISYLNYIGYDNPDDDYDNETALNFQKTYTSFTLIPQTYGGWDNSKLIKLVEDIKSKYRIDESRIYLIGYSMGGSGSWSFMNAYYDYNEHLFAGNIRLAGQSQTSVRDAIAEKTGIWLHIGLNDTEQRVTVTRDAYQFLQDYHPSATESINDVPIEGYVGKTYTLHLNGREQFKRTEYEEVGHGVSSFPFKDPKLMQWLFSQRL